MIPGSTLEFYRAALALRARHPALGAGDAVCWLEAQRGAGVPPGRRGGGFVCAVNLTGRRVPVPVPGGLLLASADVPAAGRGRVALPDDTAVWWGG
ncbi:DUF3459 domain-containing protein [Streptantibioticus rubrisoli]|uniref:DUF3459 domain-containing protein n=1 Tax=Streptantibioticus rubrisoli TaxID=1387313 RepID=UPI00355623A9